MSTPDRNALQESLLQGIRRFIAGTILFNQKVADRFGLHLTDMQCLNVLELAGAMTPGQLSAWTGLSTGGVTVMLDRLEKDGFIRREPNPADRRSILIQMNARKLKKLEPVYAEINAQIDAHLAKMSRADLECVVDFFSRLNTIRADASKK